MNEHQRRLSEVQGRYVEQIESAARAYLMQGLDSFDWSSDEGDPGYAQAAIGNLAVAVELLAKAFLARNALPLVVSGPTAAFTALCACPTALPKDFATAAHLVTSLYDGGKTKQFREAIAAVYLFVPGIRRDLDFALKQFSEHRNAALHTALPGIDRFQMLQVAWTAIKFFELIESASGLGKLSLIYLPERAKTVVKDFEVARMKRLSETVSQAKARAEKNPEVALMTLGDPRTEALTECPVCEHESLLRGDIEGDFDEDLDEDMRIRIIPVVGIFHARSLNCPTCGLRLEGLAELNEMGVETRLDVTEALAEWWATNATEEMDLADIYLDGISELENS